LWEKGVGGISLPGGERVIGGRAPGGEGRKRGREVYGFLCRMRAFSLASISFVKGFEVGDMEEIIRLG